MPTERPRNGADGGHPEDRLGPTSRARADGNAQPIPPRRSVKGAPPSFTPQTGRPRPQSGDGRRPVVVGQADPAPAASLPPQPPVAAPVRQQAPARPPASRPTASGTPSSQRASGARPSIYPRVGGPTRRPPRRRDRFRRRVLPLGALVLALLLAWPIGLALWANGQIQHVPALSAAPATPGTTYLLAGSDVRGDDSGIPQDGTAGARTDTIMVLHVPASGPAALISLPRDTYSEIPGFGPNKLNAAYAWGGPALLVQTVEQLTGLHIDHYAEIGLGGVARIVDAVGGVELCMDPAVNKVDYPVNDPDSGMVWEAPGCRVVDGASSLAFARMRKADHEGDIGRAKRQQQLIASVSSTVANPSLVFRPTDQVRLIRTGVGAVTVSDGTNIIDLGRLALAFRRATGPEGIRGTPPIASVDYQPGGVGSTVLLDPETTPAFWAAIRDGSLPPGTQGGVPGVG